jgi:hypothetical protein
MEQSPWEGSQISASEEIPLILWNPKVQYRSHLSLSLASSIQSTPPHPTSWRSIFMENEACGLKSLFCTTVHWSTVGIPLLKQVWVYGSPDGPQTVASQWPGYQRGPVAQGRTTFTAPLRLRTRSTCYRLHAAGKTAGVTCALILHTVPSLRMHGVIPPMSHAFLWQGAYLCTVIRSFTTLIRSSKTARNTKTLRRVLRSHYFPLYKL